MLKGVSSLENGQFVLLLVPARYPLFSYSSIDHGSWERNYERTADRGYFDKSTHVLKSKLEDVLARDSQYGHILRIF